MNLFKKLLEIQKNVDSFIKDGTNQSDKYDYASSELVLNVIRPKMNDLGLLLIPATRAGRVHEGTTKSGTTRFLTELEKDYIWVDAEDGETYTVPFYAQGVDLAGEKGVGKGETYGEKYFFMKFFHIPTKSDDPDSDGRTNTGEKKQKGSQAAKETQQMQKRAIAQMLVELCAGDADKIKTACLFYTKNDSRQYPGVDSVDAITGPATPVVYQNIKAAYEKKLGKPFVMSGAEVE